MEKIYTVGGRRLEGEIALSGSKNATLAILAAALVAEEGQTLLTNVPMISDVMVMSEMLEQLGVPTRFDRNTLLIDATNLQAHDAPYELIKQMRASFNVLGPILARFGAARVALPGGCDIGARPVDFHLKGLEQMGAKITVEHGYVEAFAPNGLRGADIYLEFPSVGATSHLMAAAAIAKGTTRITNAAEEPDIISCAKFINALGGKVSGAGTKTIIIEGSRPLKGARFAIDSDRIEAGTFAVAAAITGGDIYIRGALEAHLEPVSAKLIDAGVQVQFDVDGMRVKAKTGQRLNAVAIRATPFPGFPTDMQPIFAAMLTLADGTSIITETVYERRFKYLNELARMGADCKTEGNAAVIVGVDRLTGAPVAGSDLRATAALVLAGLAASGQTEVSGLQFLDRGYEAFVEKLSGVGADIWRAGEPEPGDPQLWARSGGRAIPVSAVTEDQAFCSG
ncbi:MAG: UDP-N-acetylglucosamine 1-carboxyvinyltransferase [Capsulimonadaceae bacterium]|nr:UDP-N-acetylglucosamine 1-carboxyvinyltransferase [Capsulimonadaceae bacterium]